MAHHRSSSTLNGVSANVRRTGSSVSESEITAILPFNEFGDLEELDFHYSSAFDCEAAVIRAPELDDLDDTDDLTPMSLAVPSEFRSDSRSELRTSGYAYRQSHTDTSDGAALTDVIDLTARRAGHRKQDTGKTKGRLMVAAMAVGATAAGAYSVSNPSHALTAAGDAVLAAGLPATDSVAPGSSEGIQVIAVTPASSTALHSEELARGAAFAQERAEREARMQRPLFVQPTRGMFTSGFGYRWGVLHGGIDIANSIGTPILAAADGVVIDAGPTAGYGAWVKLRHSDGTVTLYGHVNSWLVSVGERVFAGDQIATIGNRGNSTGPHLHFEVLQNGTDRVDPVNWLATRGVDVR